MAVADDPLLGLGYVSPVADRPFIRIGDDAPDGSAPATARVAEEVPIALVYNERPHVVVMGTPADFEDLAVGFTITERIVDRASDVERIDVVRASHGVEVHVHIPGSFAARLADRARGMASRTGCGLCGVERIDDALRVPARAGSTLALATDALWRAAAELSARQRINRETNAVHAAGWAAPSGDLRAVREDVGRHNALDKVLGALARDGVDAGGGFVVVTSRASYEMVQKAAACGVELLAAISRPTALAIRFAEASGVTLVGLVRNGSGNVYCGIERFTDVSR